MYRQLSRADWERVFESGEWDALSRSLYGVGADAAERAERARALLAKHEKAFGEGEAALFSSPGRTEVGGNHTDHNNGQVLCAAVTLDMLAAARKTDDGFIRIVSEGYDGMYEVDVADTAHHPEEAGSILSILRGSAEALKSAGIKVGGFNAYITSEVMRGSGLSSSAAFEVLILTVLDEFYGNGALPAPEKAVLAQYVENEYFAKPSGLMDQTACACGGLIGIDFAEQTPLIEKVDFDFEAAGYSLMVIDTGADHAELGDEYASIPSEMNIVARQFDQRVLRDVRPEEFLDALGDLKGLVPDRAILRAIHFFEENKRVQGQVAALQDKDMPKFLKLVNESGSSSWRLLQNVVIPGAAQQNLPLALGLAEYVLEGDGACRVHGGGFAGTALAFVPKVKAARFTKVLESAFGDGSVKVLGIRNIGTCAL